jgi:hypothetical protein
MLAHHWGAGGECGWITRQVAGALAWDADVHIVTPDGDTAGTGIDSVFQVHRLGTPVAPKAELRRDLLVDAILADRGVGESPPADLERQLDRDLVEPWAGAVGILAGLDPALVVIAGHRNVGALAALDAYDRNRPMALLALARHGDDVAFPHFSPVFGRAAAVLAVTEVERRVVVAEYGRSDTVRRIGAPLSANSSSKSEPNPWVGDTGYVLVRTDAPTDDADAPQADLARLLRLRFPDRPVGICHPDAFSVWHGGRLSTGWPIGRSSDLARLMAWAVMTVDLRPGVLFARECVESLLFGTPIVVPEAGRAVEHARRGRGGLWFDGAAELVRCVEALLDPVTRAALSEQGKAYAQEEFASTERFVAGVTDACAAAAG